jgi:dolichyl-phosphate beta-glucosyltransferase
MRARNTRQWTRLISQMADPQSLSVVIPAYNEQDRLPDTLRQTAAYLSNTPWTWEVRVVDDGSSDRTTDVVRDFAKAEPRVILQAEPHRGKGGAVRAGLLEASGQYRFICDADLSMPIEEISRFLPPRLVDFDVAIASREVEGARRVGEPTRRHLVGRIFNGTVKLLLLDGIQDTQCGFKMFTAQAVQTIFPLVATDGWAFDIEALYIARQRGLRIVEVPIEWHYRDRSQIRMTRDGIAMFRELLRIRTRAARGEYTMDS